MNVNNYSIVMAGGIGSRFWPMSTAEHPKQFLDILGKGHTLIQQTVSRLEKICPVENIFIVTNEKYVDLCKEQLPQLKENQIIAEPARRNTAPCIAYANFKIKAQNPDANIIVSPADHLIKDEDEFTRIINEGLQFTSQNDALLTIGIQPSRPDTGYGYINFTSSGASINPVISFTEKPDLETAKAFLADGNYSWNSGIFLWTAKSVDTAFRNHLPTMHTLFSGGEGKYNTTEEHAFIEETYAKCEDISVDYGIMEKSTNTFVITADFGWSDLGTWGSLYGHLDKDRDGNAVHGDSTHVYDGKDNIVRLPHGKTAILQGLEGYIVVEHNHTLLVCKKEDEQKIKGFVNQLNS